MSKVHNVCLVGAGFISLFHIEALKLLPDVNLVAVCDSNLPKATALAQKWGIPHIFSSVDDLIASKTCDVAHVLVPADFHRKTAEPLLAAGIHVLLEKPMAISVDDCQALVTLARKKGVTLGVSHNSAYRPSFLQLKEIIESGKVGNLHHILLHLNIPLRQLGARQFSHWMFQQPQNIFLEMGVHPLSQIYDLMGKSLEVKTLTSGRHELAPGVEIFDTWQVSMVCEKASAQLFVSVGQDFPSWQITAICQDGTIQADFLHERCLVQGRTKEMDFYNSMKTGLRLAGTTAKQSIAGAFGYVFSQLKVIPKTDPFIVSINNSVAAFYQGLDEGKKFPDGEAGLNVMRMCEEVIAHVAKPTVENNPLPQNSETKFDAVLIGGTGFIGTALVKQMLAAGLRVKVVARNIRTLPDVFHHPNVGLVSGNIANEKVIDEVIAGIPIVVHLAHGGGGETWEDIKRSMVDGTKIIAEACLRHGVKRLVYLGTLASMYLGNPAETVTGASGSDPQYETRGLYSKGKAVCEEILMQLHREKALPVVMLRPGVVVGDGGTIMHSGIGFFNQDAQMIGWNNGTNPLPFVLVDECASAIFQAMKAPSVEGKAYNVVGDVRLTASEYMIELAKATGRPYRFYPQSVVKLQLIEIGKWIIKRATGRRDAAFPSYRDLKSRGLVAKFDTSDIKNDLNWKPIQDRTEFIRQGIAIHKRS